MKTSTGAGSLIIANQISAEFGKALLGHPAQPQVLDHLDHSTPWEIPAEAEILVTYPYPAWESEEALMQERPLPNLKWVQVFSAGIERFPAWLLKNKIVGCGRGQTSKQIAEYVFAALLRREKLLDENRARAPSQWKKADVGTLEGTCLGLIGFGSIGREIARRARAFDMRVVACRRGAWTSDEEGIEAMASPEQVLEAADHVIVAVPCTDETRNFVNAATFSAAKPGLHFINISRGGVVDHDALLAALNKGSIGYATLDVTYPEPLPETHPFWTHDSVFLTPHISFLGGDHMQKFLRKTWFNLSAYAQSTPLQDIANTARGY